MKNLIATMLAPLIVLAAGPAASSGQDTGAATTTPPAAGQPAARAAQMFEKLKTLAGEWEGKSTKGWTERVEYSVIAGGSVLMEISYGAHPGEWMSTMYHMDGEHLMLTHYCIARNQPRLRATEISDDLSTVTFTFLDGTNLPSRDKGHMDKVVIRFEGPDRFWSRWTWYQDGKESWMEDIEHRRAAATPPVAPAEGAKHEHGKP